MLILTLIGTMLNLYLAKRSNDRFKKEEMDKKADVVFVEKEIARVEKTTDLKIKAISEHQEEHKTLLEHIVQRIDFIYETHYKP